MNPALVPVYTESMRLCGNWLAESCLESPGVILEKYLERVKSLPVCCRERASCSYDTRGSAIIQYYRQRSEIVDDCRNVIKDSFKNFSQAIGPVSRI